MLDVLQNVNREKYICMCFLQGVRSCLNLAEKGGELLQGADKCNYTKADAERVRHGCLQATCSLYLGAYQVQAG